MAARRRGSGNAGANNDNKYASLLKDIYQIRIDGRSVVELFEEVPDAQMYPDYRDVVYVPISLAEIGKRIRVGAYEDDDSIISDFELMAENARLYNGNESPVYDDAVDILDFVLLYFKRPLSKITRLRLQTQIVNELTSYKYKGRKFSDAFMAEPDAKTYPNYRTIIKEPTSFAKVYKQLEKEPFPSWTEFRESVDLIFANALKYNQEGSQIANDANSLRKQLIIRLKSIQLCPNICKQLLVLSLTNLPLIIALGTASNQKAIVKTKMTMRTAMKIVEMMNPRLWHLNMRMMMMTILKLIAMIWTMKIERTK
mgnify:CR=1 FL=1